MKGMGRGVVSCPFDRLGTHNTQSVSPRLSDCEDIRPVSCVATLMSYVVTLMSYISSLMSYVATLMSYVATLMSYVTTLMSYVAVWQRCQQRCCQQQRRQQQCCQQQRRQQQRRQQPSSRKNCLYLINYHGLLCFKKDKSS